MSAWRVARAAVRALSLIVIAASGWYLLVYLYRWEWNRALISGLFFLAALLTFSTSLILGAFRSVNERLDRIEGVIASSRGARPPSGPPPGTDGAVADDAGGGPGTAPTDQGPRRPRQFDWLHEPIDGFGVFVPVLIGAGVVLSGVAYMIERVAGLLTGALVDRRTTQLLEPDLALSDAPAFLPRAGVRREHVHSPLSRGLAWTVAVAVLALVAVAGVNTLAEATQSGEEVLDPTQETAVELKVRQKRVQRPDVVVAQALWTACSGRLPPEVQLVGVEDLGDDHVRLRFDRALGDLSRRRLFGCFEDGTLDFVTAHVTGFEIQPR